MKRIKKHASLLALGTAALLGLAACSSGGGGGDVASSAPAASELSGTITLWHHYSDREAGIIQDAVVDFEKAYPKVKVEVSAGQEDTKIAQVAATGSKVDVMITNLNNTLGTLCKSMADLQPYMDRDGVKESDFQPVFAEATKFNGKRCALPTTSDVYGLYYNTDMLKKAGYSAPPKTLQDLEAMALKLTTYNVDGSIKTLGFNPLVGNGQVISSTLGQAAGGDWMGDGKSVISQNKQWSDLVAWQKAFVDKIGYDKLKTFSSSAGDEFSADNPFQNDKVAMALDGEWRVAFIADQAPKLAYATAPFPVLEGSGQTYGGGYASGANIGVNSKSKNMEAAWALTKFLATDTKTAVNIANGFKNIPTLKAAAESSDLEVPETYRTFVEASGNPATATSPVTSIGATLAQTFTTFWADYQSGAADDAKLQSGLQQVDKDIDNALSLGGAK